MVDLAQKEVDGVGHDVQGGELDDDPLGDAFPRSGIGMIFGGDAGVRQFHFDSVRSRSEPWRKKWERTVGG